MRSIDYVYKAVQVVAGSSKLEVGKSRENNAFPRQRGYVNETRAEDEGTEME